MRKRQLLIFLFLFFLFSGLILPNYNSTLGQVVPGYEFLQNPISGLGGEGIDNWSNTVLGGLGTVAKWFFSGLIAGVSGILIIVSGVFLSWARFLLNLVTSPTFINISFTGSDNVFVTTGWGIIRDLTNIFVILGLVVIALATILRITSYQMKKTLPLLLIVALLINFTPMLCGLVIDASNIIMNHFLKGGGLLTEKFTEIIGNEISQLWQMKDVSETLGRGIVAVGFNVVGGLIFILFALLFLFRYVALWMLVILSPLALFCYIFPATRKMWDQWLSQFIQWSFIGIPTAFTLYLASMMTEILVEGGAIEGVKGGAEIFGYLVPLCFLVIGFLMSLQIGGIGASIATGWFKKGEARLGKEIPKGTEKVTRGIRERIGEKLAIKKTGKHEKGAEGKEEKERGGLFGYAGRGLLANVARHDREELENAQKRAKGKSLAEQNASLHNPRAVTRIGTLGTVMEEGNIDKLGKATGFSKGNEEKIMRDALKFFPSIFKDLANSETKIAEKIVGKFGEKISESSAKKAGVFMTQNDIDKFHTISEKLASTAKEKDISKWSEETMNAALESGVFHKELKGSKISAMAKQFGDVFFEAFKTKAATEGWYKENNTAVYNYIPSGAGHALGVDFGKQAQPWETTTTATTTPKEVKEEKEKGGEKKRGPGIGTYKSEI
jgi:hypothetical protein